MTGQEYIRILEAQNKLMIELLSDALMALLDLGACDDPGCDEPNCLHVLPKIKQALENKEGPRNVYRGMTKKPMN